MVVIANKGKIYSIEDFESLAGKTIKEGLLRQFYCMFTQTMIKDAENKGSYFTLFPDSHPFKVTISAIGEGPLLFKSFKKKQF